MGLFDRFLKSLGFKGKGPKSIRETKVDPRLLKPELASPPRRLSGQGTKGAVRRGLGGLRGHIPTVTQWQGRNDEDDFLFFGNWYNVQSSNVAAFRYLEASQILFVRFNNGAVYGYEPVTLEMARQAFHAGSKGKWVWDRLRIRGTAYGHHVNYYYDQGQSTHIPLYRLEGGEREARHDREALEDGGKYTGFFTGGQPWNEQSATGPGPL